jgi:pyruvate dehydrogenase E1 component alpha subunit
MSRVRVVARGKFPESLRKMWEDMVLLRTLDDALVQKQRDGKIAYYTSCAGEEGAIVGAVYALRQQDWVFPSPREVTTTLLRGLPLETLLAHFYGSAEDVQKGRQRPNFFGAKVARVAPVSGTISSHIPQAVGYAWAARKAKDDVVTLAMFGDGATSQGEFHNGCNFAGVFKVPTILLCRNNGRAGSLGVAQQTKVKVLADKCVAYGIDGLLVDGSDTLAVFAAVSEAHARALRGEGATLIEATTHPDDSSKDPLVRLSVDAGVPAKEQAEFVEACRARVADAIERAEKAPAPARNTLITDVFQNVPAHLQEALS